MVDREVVRGAIDEPDAVIVGDGSGFFNFMVERDLGAVSIEGDVDAVRELLAALPQLPATEVQA